jgi:hypothetical protein
LINRIKQITVPFAGPTGDAFWLGADRAWRIGLNFVVCLLVVSDLGSIGTGG